MAQAERAGGFPRPDHRNHVTDSRPVDQIDEYRLVREIGRGAMGAVYLAEDTLLDRPVAVKFIAERRPDAETKRYFFLEARAVAKLSHPNVVAVHRVGEIDGRPFLVTELVRGRSLADVDRPLAHDTLVAVAQGIARGLGAAHDKGVLHRDIKPANVMLTDEGEVKLVDFGLAKIGGAPVFADRATDMTDASRSESGFVGTPRYMAPEIFDGRVATARSDLYAVGASLYELATGVSPRDTMPEDVPPDVWIAARDVAPILARAPSLDPRLAAVVDRCLAHDPAARFASAHELAEALATLTEPAAPAPEGNPYRGLTPFEAEHRALFFGRSAEARAVVDRLRSDGLVVVTGDSGVGKSSLCRAGVLPLVADGALGDERAYRVASLVPGRRPLASLAAALAAALDLDEAALASQAREDPSRVAIAVRAALGHERGLVLFVDQLEELIALSDAAEVPSFLDIATGLSAVSSGVRVLFAARGDYITRLALLPGFSDAFLRALYLVRPLSRDGVRAAITGPLASRGVTFEPPALVDALVDAGEQGGLPLLQFALSALWEAREGQAIPARALDAMGGVEGALTRHADDVLDSLAPDARAAARRVLLRLVTAEGTRARRTATELDALAGSAREALEALVRGRLVVAGAETYEIAHEALLDRWSTLRGFLDEGGARRALAERADVAAATWERLARAPDALLRGKQLDELSILDRGDLSARAAALLDASKARARADRARTLALVLSVPLALGVALGGLRYKSARDLDRLVQGHVATANRDLSEGHARVKGAHDRRKKAYALFDGATDATTEEVNAKKEEAERVWSEALEASREAESKLVKAGQSLEAALALDPGRATLRAAIGDVTMDRLSLADGFHVEDRKADLLLRLASYDPDGSRRQALSQAPLLSLSTSPKGATVTLERYEDQRGRKVAISVGGLGKTPLRDVAIAGGPGSYRLVLKAEGRVEVRYPVLLGAGERFAAEVVLPEEKAVPAGFVYVPAGRFLVGSAEAEGLRKGFIMAAPIHEARTLAFSISKTEVTYGEWLTFLDTLPAEERAKRSPATQTAMWGLEVKPVDGTWQLTLTLNGARLVAKRGEPIVLPARSKRSTIAWERLPVSGISMDDAEAYFRWLDTTGRVPGARPCDEREWERAFRGADARLYPHGDALEPDDANFDLTYGRKPLAFGPDEVGSHPASESPFGLLDMTGNAYELTRAATSAGEVMIRGGAWYYDSTSAIAPSRTPAERNTRDYLTGVRGCAAVER